MLCTRQEERRAHARTPLPTYRVFLVYFSMTRRRANCASLVRWSASSRITSFTPVLQCVCVGVGCIQVGIRLLSQCCTCVSDVMYHIDRSTRGAGLVGPVSHKSHIQTSRGSVAIIRCAGAGERNAPEEALGAGELLDLLPHHVDAALVRGVELQRHGLVLGPVHLPVVVIVVGRIVAV